MLENRRKAFSMVELVIVIVILGIIAAVAIPRISSGSKNAGESALKADLATLRNAIDWYYGEHNATYPGAKTDGTNAADSPEAFISQLTMYSNKAGAVSADKDAAFPFGPYVRGNFPRLPAGINAGKSTVTVVNQAAPLTAAPGDGTGWVYNTATGQVIANATAVGNDGSGYDTY